MDGTCLVKQTKGRVSKLLRIGVYCTVGDIKEADRERRCL